MLRLQTGRRCATGPLRRLIRATAPPLVTGALEEGGQWKHRSQGAWLSTLTSADEGGSRSSRGTGGRHWNWEAVLAVVGIVGLSSGVAYEGARLKNEETRLVDKAEAREAHRAMEHKRELDKAEAEVKRLADKAEIYHYMAQVAGTHDYERLWRNLQETVKTAAAGGGMGKGKGED